MKNEWPRITEVTSENITFSKDPFSSLDSITQVNQKLLEALAQLAVLSGIDVSFERGFQEHWKFYKTSLVSSFAENETDVDEPWPRGQILLNSRLINEYVRATEANHKAKRYAHLISASLRGGLRELSRTNTMEASSLRDLGEEGITLMAVWLIWMSLNYDNRLQNPAFYSTTAIETLVGYTIASNLYRLVTNSEKKGAGKPYGVFGSIKPFRHLATSLLSMRPLAKVAKA